jgi:hypothetical protein
MRLVFPRAGAVFEQPTRTADRLPAEEALALSLAAVRQRTLELSSPEEDETDAAEAVLSLLQQLKAECRNGPGHTPQRALVLLTLHGTSSV